MRQSIQPHKPPPIRVNHILQYVVSAEDNRSTQAMPNRAHRRATTLPGEDWQEVCHPVRSAWNVDCPGDARC